MESPASRRQGRNRLLNGVVNAQNRLARSKRMLAAQLDWLHSRDLVESRISNDRLDVHGLFYLHESGLLLTYQRHSGEFVPLGKTVSIF